jgi:hypothetical protein
VLRIEAPPPPKPPSSWDRWSDGDGRLPAAEPSDDRTQEWDPLSPETVTVPPEDIIAIDQDPGEPPFDDGLPLLAEESAARRRATGPAVPVPPPPPVPDRPAAAVPGDAVFIPGLTDRPALRDHPHRPAKKKGLPARFMAAIAGLAALVVVLIASIVYFASRGKPDSGQTVATDGKQVKAGPKVPVLAIDWPEDQRAGASLSINNVPWAIPLTGPIEIPLPPSNQQYEFVLRRPGFQPKSFSRASGTDDQSFNATRWEAVAQGMDWPQDFDAAKKTAEREGKNVLIFFDASDSKESRFASRRFIDAVADSKDFRQRAAKEYVCVYIDNPQGEEAKGKVKNLARNRKVTENFCITIFPTVVVTDYRGYPFGMLEDYKINGLAPFLQLMDEWAVERKYLLALLAATDAMPKESGNPVIVGKALDFIEVNNLQRFYAHTIKKLNARLPNGRDPAVTDDLAAMWKQKFHLARGNPDAAKKIVDEFDEWKKARIFKDREIGAALHLLAADVLLNVGQNFGREAVQECKQGLAFDPQNPLVRSGLEAYHQALTGERPEVAVGTGTGFCIAQGNFILTNHHVIEGARKIKVHLNGEKGKYPAQVIADNEASDMALLKIELPADKTLAPIPLAATTLKIGDDVCAMGFPGVLSQNITLTLTKGVVSTLPDPADEETYIATDCKVNPGNSGGPLLCGSSGGIAGMVTAKSHINEREDSYGLVIPVDRLRKFLVKSLPPESRNLPPPSAGAANLKLSELAEIISPSVVYIENLQ